MKLLVVNWLDPDNPQAGGAEIHLFEILRRLVDRGHQVSVIASGWPGGTGRATIDGVTVCRYGGRHSFALRGRGAVRRTLRADGFDLVVEDINKLPLYVPTLTRLPVYVIVPHLFGATAFREAAVPVASIVWLSEKAIPTLYRRSAFHAISASTRDDLIRRGISSAAVRVIYPGVDADWYTPDPETSRASVPTFLYVGRLKRYKGVATALRAVAMARGRGHDLRLQIAGGGGDRARLERIAARLNLGDAAQFLGFVTEERKRELLRQAWAVVFPSAKEGWGMSNIEGAACGTPAIASDSPGLRETVLDGETGMLVPHGDAEALATALVRLSANRYLVESCGQAARRFAETMPWDRTAERTEAHLLETLEDARRGHQEQSIHAHSGDSTPLRNS